MSPTVELGRRPTPLRQSPFGYTRPPRAPGILDRLLGRPRPDLAGEALQNLLARLDPARITQTDVSALLLRYHVVGGEARVVLARMWRRVLGAFLADDVLSEREMTYLRELARAFTLSAAEVQAAERDVVHPRYERAVQAAMSDRQVTAEERAMLDRMAAQLRIPPGAERQIYERSARQLLDGLLQESIADRRVSPEELERMAQVARQLGVSVRATEEAEALVDRYALFWRIENGDLPQAETSIGLERGETCHLRCRGSWHDYRPGRPDADEGVLATRIARGVYFRAGSVSGEPVDRARCAGAEEGALHVTNRRVVFDGRRRQRVLELQRIDAFQVHADGVVLEPKQGEPVALLLQGDVEHAAVVLGAALARA